jgi:membrane protease YdiL (CAAX protease family)
MHNANASSNSPSNPSVPWTSRDVTWGLLAFILWMSFLLLASLISENLALPVDTGLVIIFGEAVLLVPVWYLTVRKYGVSWADLGLRKFHPAAVGIGCGLMLLSLLFNFIYASILAIFDLQIQPDINQLFDQTAYPFALLIGGAVVAPFVEEVFFRGFIFTGLIKKWNWKWAAFISSALFAIAHVVPTSLLPIFILGWIFAFLYKASGSIWPAILMHMLTNTLALSAAYAISQGWVPAP